MCGIAGILCPEAETARRAVSAMMAAQVHRGPDDCGESIHPMGRRFLALGHRRLSILDLSAAGHQPMIHPQTGDQIIFNGEIYNFPDLRRELESTGEAFRGHSDTEVLLHGLSRWGSEYLGRLEGMFALAFFNAKDQTLLLARDSIGIKPLYVARSGGNLLFASEVRAILASGLVPHRHSPQGLATLLAYGAIQEPFTIVENIRVFPPGCHQLIKDEEASPPVAFWRYPAQPAPPPADPHRAVASTLDAAVRDHLVSDVPVGVFLSSGLDSTIVAGLAARHTTHLRSFTVGFPDQPDMSEQELASETASRFGLDHVDVAVSGPEAESAAGEWMQSLDQPSVDGLNTYLISKVVRREGIVVALSGLGGDELFGGYSSFPDVRRLYRMMRLIQWLPRVARVAVANAATCSRPEIVRHKLRDIMHTSGSVLDLYLQRRRLMSGPRLQSLGVESRPLGLSDSFQDPELLRSIPSRRDDITWSVSQFECRFYQGNMLLRDTDTNGMAHSLEIRVPMLDQRMLDLMLPLPGPARLPNGINDKHLLRISFPDLLRPELLNQAKRGFSLPIRRWMIGPMRDMCQSAIDSLSSSGILRKEGVDSTWQSFLANPETQIWSRAFTLCVLGLYLQRTRLG